MTRDRVIVVVTGVPGSGKTSLATALARALGIPLVSLDAIKEQLYADKAGLDPFGLRLAAEAELGARLDESTRRAGAGVVAVVDIWVAPGRDGGRVRELLGGRGCRVVELVCRVPGALAAQRYAARPRTAPHLPPDAATLRRIHEAAEQLSPLGIGHCIDVDTSRPVDVPELLALLKPSDAPDGPIDRPTEADR